MQALEETDFGDLCELFAPLMHVICLIFSTSAHYNTPARIIVLVQVAILCYHISHFGVSHGIAVVCFRCYLVNPHVQTVQNMYGKRGEEFLKLSYGRSKFLISREKKIPWEVLQKAGLHKFEFRAKSS